MVGGLEEISAVARLSAAFDLIVVGPAEFLETFVLLLDHLNLDYKGAANPSSQHQIHSIGDVYEMTTV
jgi:hypothetical protein